MDTRKFDVVVVGAGSAGLAAHAAAMRVTASVLLIEAGVGGTTCARAGCMPSKLLIAAAHACREVAGAGTFGINVTGVSVDGAAVMRRVQALRDEFVAGVLRDVAEIPSGQRLQGLAHFEDMRTLRVNGERIEAGRVVIATGSLPQIPASFAELGDRLLTTDNVFDLPTLPASIAVIGGGTVGLELGQAFHALGVRTRLFHNGRTLGPKGDADMTALATRLFTEDLPCELGVQAAPTRHSPHEVELGWTGDDGVPRTEAFEYVLMAAGRKPSLASLNLAASGLELDEHGVPRFDPATMQCGDSTVFMAGDVDARWPILHEATADGRIAGDNAARHPQHRP
ncbi:MAG: pyridine nucleotide-disulfide oxidoreductase dimerization region, partial [Rhizobacter sp.]|nr:pyridine nucleotide-disulfide oxidoreductase dimerization region [Rhizobacter sp.]